MLQFLLFSSLALRILVRVMSGFSGFSSLNKDYTDVPTFETHLVRVATAGICPVIAGSMGEATHLSHAERVTLVRVARKALDVARCSNIPIIVGTGAGSTRETIELTHEAAAAGADYALVIASGYFAGALTKEALKAYWIEVSQKSSIPVMIYNCK